MVSIPRPCLKLNTHPEEGNNISPVSPKSWEESLSELSVGLSRICGSPAVSDQLSPPLPQDTSPLSTTPEDSPVHTWTPPAPDLLTGPTVASCSGPHSTTPSTPPVTIGIYTHVSGSLYRHSPPSHHQPLSKSFHGYSRSVSLPQQRPSSHIIPTAGLKTPHFGHFALGVTKPLKVRQEQSHQRLQEKLAEICRAKSPVTAAGAAAGTAASSPIPRDLSAFKHLPFRKNSLNVGFRHRVDISKHPVHELAVSIDPTGCSLTVTAMRAGREPKLVATVSLPKDTKTRHLVCCARNETLWLRERSRPLLTLEYSDNMCQNLPILVEDQDKPEMTVILHVSPVFGHEDVGVRILDDTLVISCRRLVQSGAGPELRSVVRLDLPRGADSTSVSAMLAQGNQVVVKAKLDGQTRRFTWS